MFIYNIDVLYVYLPRNAFFCQEKYPWNNADTGNE